MLIILIVLVKKQNNNEMKKDSSIKTIHLTSVYININTTQDSTKMKMCCHWLILMRQKSNPKFKDNIKQKEKGFNNDYFS